MNLKHLIYEYLYLKNIRVEDEFILLKRNTWYRKMDELDYLEYIIVLTRLKMFQEISNDIQKILRMTAE